MFLNINLCDTSAGMWSFYIVKTFISIVCIIIPLIIIVNSFRLLFGSVITADKLKENAMQIMKSVIAGLIVFFIPTMMNFVFGTLIEFDDSSLSECYTSSSMEKVQSLREKEAQEKEEMRKQQEKENEEALKKKAEDEKKKKELMERNEKADETKPSSSTNASSLFEAAKKADELTFNGGYTYGLASAWDGQNYSNKLVACDRGVGLALYFAGWKDVSPEQLTLAGLETYLPQWGWKKITNFNDIQPGDIVFYDRAHNGYMDSSDHVFLVGEDVNTRYDWGSTARIQHQGGYSGGMPFTEPINSSEFGWAYRQP